MAAKANPGKLNMKMESCGHPGTDYDDEARVVTICCETPFDFAGGGGCQLRWRSPAEGWGALEPRPIRNVYAFSAARTRSGVIGYSLMRAPVASKNALAIAPTAAPITSSPAPVERSLSRWTTIGVTLGWSAKRSTG